MQGGRGLCKVGRRVEAIKAFEDQVAIENSMGIVSKELHALKHLADSLQNGAMSRAQRRICK